MSLQHLEDILRLAKSCEYETQHAHQVMRLALSLFDELEVLHGFGDQERLWLQYSAILHDIGWIEGQKGHHKTSLRLILDSSLLPFTARERLIVGSIARYHRKALPKQKHDHYAALAPEDQQRVNMLAGILRVADGLDRTHQNLVEGLTCTITPQRIVVRFRSTGPAHAEKMAALKKGDLLARASDRLLDVTYVPD